MSLENTEIPDMKSIWNGKGGQVWVENQKLLDGMFKPFEDCLVKAVLDSGKVNILDIGCGAGATSLATSWVLGETGKVTGVDVSKALIQAAKERTTIGEISTQFICSDAQSYRFEEAVYDMVISRFGVMFFDDPVAAFKNFHGAATTDAQLHMYAWRSPTENPFMTAAQKAAAPYMQGLPKPEPNAPGQFGFANADYVREILTKAGWKGVEIEPIDLDCSLAAGELEKYNTNLGVLGMIYDQLDNETREEVRLKVQSAFQSFVKGDRAEFVAACWKITASAN